MKNKVFILAFTFLCLLIGPSSYGQDWEDMGFSDEINDLLQSFEDQGGHVEVYDNVADYVDAVNNDNDYSNDFVDYNSDGNIDAFDNLEKQLTTNILDLPMTISDEDLKAILETGIQLNNVDIPAFIPSPDSDPGWPDPEPYDICTYFPLYCDIFLDDSPPGPNPEPDPDVCTLVSCSTSKQVVDYEQCLCVPKIRPWFLDKDGDGWHDTSTAIIESDESPGSSWFDSTKGADCDDNNIMANVLCSTTIPWYLDYDNDGFYGEIMESVSWPGNFWKATTYGEDCNDDDPTKALDCSSTNPCDGKISKAALLAAASLLHLTVEHILAVFEVESEGNAFRSNGDPKILFERHYFSALTNGIYDQSNPDISNPNQGGYGTYDEQLDKLARAFALNPEAAVKSASFGAFQIMGKNYAQAGYTNATAFYNDMTSRNLDKHLNAFANFIITNDLVGKLQNNQWANFAAKYNGPQYKKNDYDTKMATEYQKLKSDLNLLAKDCF
ncbi:N-acetylmuramidase family protein [Flavobacterium branchiicola]|uniref:N-acetylmuramidase family protein n=1 Tax=Flavobacterium branchiicola TaxID=1114875 RepID=A0ABV9PI92_9FLAO|nr:N-acetylmuramidase family protein [Flavobacterium branchiicola]MBS7256357.1 N-acetylmuramidase family protein [Flavobacterium branchiicola]